MKHQRCWQLHEVSCYFDMNTNRRLVPRRDRRARHDGPANPKHLLLMTHPMSLLWSYFLFLIFCQRIMPCLVYLAPRLTFEAISLLLFDKFRVRSAGKVRPEIHLFIRYCICLLPLHRRFIFIWCSLKVRRITWSKQLCTADTLAISFFSAVRVSSLQQLF